MTTQIHTDYPANPQKTSPTSQRWLTMALKIILITCLALGGQRVGASVYLLAKAELAQVLIARAWHKSRASSQPVKPWPWADTHPAARLHVPRLGISQYLLANASNRNLAFGAAHVPGSGWPGQNRSAAFAGHRDSHFAFLQHLKNSDIIEIETDRTRRYRVQSTRIIDSRDQDIPLTETEQLLLATCYPFDQWQAGGPLRYLITTNPVSRPKNQEQPGNRPRDKPNRPL